MFKIKRKHLDDLTITLRKKYNFSDSLHLNEMLTHLGWMFTHNSTGDVNVVAGSSNYQDETNIIYTNLPKEGIIKFLKTIAPYVNHGSRLTINETIFCFEDGTVYKEPTPKVTKPPRVGRKEDKGKLRYSLIPPIVLSEMALMLTLGAEKYTDDNWKFVEDPQIRYMDALFRHIEAYRSGELLDNETGESHLSHAIINLAFLIHFEKSKTVDKEC